MFSGNILQRIPYFSRTDQENYASAEDVQLRLGDNCLLIADNKLVLDGKEPQVCVSVLFDGSITLSLRNIEAHQSASPLKIYINGVLCNDSNASALYTLNIDDTVMIDTFQYCFIVKGDVDDDEDYSHVDYSGFQGKQAPKKKCETIDEVLREVQYHNSDYFVSLRRLSDNILSHAFDKVSSQGNEGRSCSHFEYSSVFSTSSDEMNREVSGLLTGISVAAFSEICLWSEIFHCLLVENVQLGNLLQVGGQTSCFSKKVLPFDNTPGVFSLFLDDELKMAPYGVGNGIVSRTGPLHLLGSPGNQNSYSAGGAHSYMPLLDSVDLLHLCRTSEENGESKADMLEGKLVSICESMRSFSHATYLLISKLGKLSGYCDSNTKVNAEALVSLHNRRVGVVMSPFFAWGCSQGDNQQCNDHVSILSACLIQLLFKKCVSSNSNGHDTEYYVYNDGISYESWIVLCSKVLCFFGNIDVEGESEESLLAAINNAGCDDEVSIPSSPADTTGTPSTRTRGLSYEVKSIYSILLCSLDIGNKYRRPSELELGSPGGRVGLAGAPRCKTCRQILHANVEVCLQTVLLMRVKRTFLQNCRGQACPLNRFIDDYLALVPKLRLKYAHLCVPGVAKHMKCTCTSRAFPADVMNLTTDVSRLGNRSDTDKNTVAMSIDTPQKSISIKVNSTGKLSLEHGNSPAPDRGAKNGADSAGNSYVGAQVRSASSTPRVRSRSSHPSTRGDLTSPTISSSNKNRSKVFRETGSALLLSPTKHGPTNRVSSPARKPVYTSTHSGRNQRNTSLRDDAPPDTIESEQANRLLDKPTGQRDSKPRKIAASVEPRTNSDSGADVRTVERRYEKSVTVGQFASTPAPTPSLTNKDSNGPHGEGKDYFYHKRYSSAGAITAEIEMGAGSRLVEAGYESLCESGYESAHSMTWRSVASVDEEEDFCEDDTSYHSSKLYDSILRSAAKPGNALDESPVVDVMLPSIDGSGDCVVSFVVRVIQKDKDHRRSNDQPKKKSMHSPPSESFCDEILRSISVEKVENNMGEPISKDTHQFDNRVDTFEDELSMHRMSINSDVENSITSYSHQKQNCSPERLIAADKCVSPRNAETCIALPKPHVSSEHYSSPPIRPGNWMVAKNAEVVAGVESFASPVRNTFASASTGGHKDRKSTGVRSRSPPIRPGNLMVTKSAEVVAGVESLASPVRDTFASASTGGHKERSPSPLMRDRKIPSPTKNAPMVSISPMVALKRTKKLPKLALPVPFALKKRRDANELLKMIENQTSLWTIFHYYARKQGSREGQAKIKKEVSDAFCSAAATVPNTHGVRMEDLTDHIERVMETIPGSGNSKSTNNVFPLPTYNSALSDKFDILSPLMILHFLKDYCVLDSAVKCSGLDEHGELQLYRTLHDLCVTVIIDSIGNTKSMNLLMQSTGRKSDLKPRNSPNFRSKVGISSDNVERVYETPVKSPDEALKIIQKHQHLHEVPRVDVSALNEPGCAGKPGDLKLPVHLLVTYINFNVFQKIIVRIAMELEYSKCISNIMNYEKETPVLTSPPQNYSYSSPGQTSADKSRNKELPASVASSNAIPDSGDTSRKSHNKNLSISQKKRSLATLIKPLSTHAHFYAQSDAEIPSVREDTVPSAGKAGHSPSKGGHAELPEIDEDGVILLDAYRAIRVLLRTLNNAKERNKIISNCSTVRPLFVLQKG